MAGELENLRHEKNSAIEVYRSSDAAPETFEQLRFWITQELRRIQNMGFSTEAAIKTLANSIGDDTGTGECECEDGAPGPRGPQGPQGDKGDPGEDGEDGNAGDLINDSITVSDKTWSSVKIDQEKADRRDIVKNPAVWGGPWEQKTYNPNIMVNDGLWLMISNRVTDDRAAPQPEGDPVPIYPTPPTWTTNSHGGHVYSVLEFQVPSDDLYQISVLEIWVENTTAQDHYQVYAVNADTGIFELLAQFDGDVVGSPGFYNIPIASEYLPRGVKGRIYLDQWNTASSGSQVYPWTRASNSNQNTDPGTGNWNRRNNNTEIRLNKTDEQDVDRSAVLLDPTLVGTRIRFADQADVNAYAEWTINAINDEGTFVNYNVSGKTEGPNGEPSVGTVCDTTLEVPVLASTDYVTASGHLTQWPAIQSYVSLDDPTIGVPSQDGVAINLTFQVFSASIYWDFMAYSG